MITIELTKRTEGEKEAHAGRYHRLAAEICVHVSVDVAHDGHYLRTDLARDKMAVVCPDLREVNHQEDEVHKADEDDYQFAQPAQSAGDPISYFRQQLLDRVG